MASIKLNYDVVNAQVAASSNNQDNYLIVVDNNPEKTPFTIPAAMGGEFTNIYLSGKNLVDTPTDGN